MGEVLTVTDLGLPTVAEDPPVTDLGLPAVAEDPPVTADPWPDPPASEAYYGLAGDLVHALDPHTEADSVAILAQSLVVYGNVVGRYAYYQVEADRHYPNLFVGIIGSTGKGRKGTSFGRVRNVLAPLDPAWAAERISSGLSSGEGLVWHVRDAVEVQKTNKETGAVETVIVDEGVSDKRLLAVEPELASVLRVMARDGCTLSALVRQAWDTGALRTLTKNNPAHATGAHISIIGHITADELRRYLDHTEVGNGFANRFLWLCVRRSKLLPFGGGEPEWGEIPDRLRAAAEFGREERRLVFDGAARDAWAEVYPKLSASAPGLLGAVTSRAEAQVCRLALVHALLDCSATIRPEHLLAALALWEFAAASARFVFGASLGDPVADEILSALRRAPEGMTRTELRDLFGRNRPAQEIGRALGVLVASGLARATTVETGGRPAEVWRAE